MIHLELIKLLTSMICQAAKCGQNFYAIYIHVTIIVRSRGYVQDLPASAPGRAPLFAACLQMH